MLRFGIDAIVNKFRRF